MKGMDLCNSFRQGRDGRDHRMPKRARCRHNALRLDVALAGPDQKPTLARQPRCFEHFDALADRRLDHDSVLHKILCDRFLVTNSSERFPSRSRLGKPVMPRMFTYRNFGLTGTDSQRINLYRQIYLLKCGTRNCQNSLATRCCALRARHEQGIEEHGRNYLPRRPRRCGHGCFVTDWFELT